jgi:hypothetical protein
MNTSFWEAFWLMVIFIPLVLIWGFALVDIFRRDDMSGGVKALWVCCVILLPFFGTLMYLIFRPMGATQEEREAIDQANRQFVETYTPTNTSEQLRTLADLHDRGKLSDTEFAVEKSRILQTAGQVDQSVPPNATVRSG